MDAKLTLSLDKDVIARAKKYAQEKKTSLSFLVEQYLQRLVSPYPSQEDAAPSIVEELSGIMELGEDFDYKSSLTTYLSNKYK